MDSEMPRCPYIGNAWWPSRMERRRCLGRGMGWLVAVPRKQGYVARVTRSWHLGPCLVGPVGAAWAIAYALASVGQREVEGGEVR